MRHFQWARKGGGRGGGGPSKCIKHPNQIKNITFLNPFGHSYCLYNRLGKNITGIST